MEMDKSYLTAIRRNKLSTPTNYLLKKGLLVIESMLDYGCGRGDDVDWLHIEGYDPYYRPKYPTTKYNNITCNYVLNVLPKEEWQGVLDNVYDLLEQNGTAYITVRNDRKKLNGVTSKGTYQTFVELDLPIIRKTPSYIIYELKKRRER